MAAAAQVVLAAFFTSLSALSLQDGWEAQELLRRLGPASQPMGQRIVVLEQRCAEALRQLPRGRWVRTFRRALRAANASVWRSAQHWQQFDPGVLLERSSRLREEAHVCQARALGPAADYLLLEATRCDTLLGHVHAALARMEIHAARLEHTYGALLDARSAPALLDSVRTGSSVDRLERLVSIWDLDAEALSAASQPEREAMAAGP